MAKKKTEFDKAVERAAKIILDQLNTLPPQVAKQKRRELEQMAAKASRAAKNGRRSRLERTQATRLSARSRAKTA
jgi:hypothetical protein